MTCKNLQAKSPASGEFIGELAETSQEQIYEIQARAKAAFATWAMTPLEKRLQYLQKLRLYLVDHLEELAAEISHSTGKAKLESLTADIAPVLEAIKHMEKHAKAILSRRRMPTPLLLFGKQSYIEYKPRGVVLVIAPWNFPFQLSVVPALSAVAAGNCVIIKPSEVTPWVGVLVERALEACGFPPGIVQVAHGGAEVGAALVASKPDYIFFTGSVRTGKLIQAEAARHLIPTTMELGGKDPMIVFADANLERAVGGAVWGGFTNCGQVCMSVERLYVERPLYEQFTKRLVEEVSKLRQDLSDETDLGSLTFAGQADVISDHIQEALDKGAKLLTGRPPSDWDLTKGLIIPPMVLANVTSDMKIVQEETFGPILPVMPFDTEEEAITLANDSPYGLNASVWSSNLQRAQRVASRLVSGGVVINDVLVTVFNSHLPFGGAKESGLGSYHGEGGLRIFCHETAVMLDKGKRRRELAWYPYAGKFSPLATLLRNYYGRKTNWREFIRAFSALQRGQE